MKILKPDCNTKVSINENMKFQTETEFCALFLISFFYMAYLSDIDLIYFYFCNIILNIYNLCLMAQK